MVTFPNAKINIGLNITSKRADGYHNLETVFYPIKIRDGLEVITSENMHFQSSGLTIPGKEEDNLCIRSYHLICKDYHLPPVSIHLHKHIPIGAGLGGGSADGAFFIRLLNDYFDLGLSRHKMLAYASQLGADCAFFIDNKPAFADEKGDRLESVHLDLSAYEIILIMPEVSVSTATAYSGVKPAVPESSLKEIIQLPVEEWKLHLKNDFERSVFKKFPTLSWIKAALYDRGAIYASMSGSGSSIYGIFKVKPDLTELEKSHQVFYTI